MNTKENMNVAVFLPTAKCRPWLGLAIESILNQSWKNFDLYVVDDASGDVDPSFLTRYPAVSFLRMTKSWGPYVIDNLLMRKTRSTFIAFQDADDWSFPQRFEKQLQLINRHQLDGCGTWSIHIDLMREPIGYETFPFDASQAGTRGYLYPLRHPTALLYRYIFDELGGFDNETRFGADAEYLFRAFLSFQLGNVQEFLYYHTIHPNSLTHSKETGFQSTKRKAYNEPLHIEMNAIMTGERQKPSAGFLLNGKKASVEELPDFEVLQIGKGNISWI